MIYDVITTDQADVDLRGTYEYIAFELLSPDNAAGQLGRLEEQIVGLAELSGVHENTLFNILAGIKEPDIGTACRIADVRGICVR